MLTTCGDIDKTLNLDLNLDDNIEATTYNDVNMRRNKDNTFIEHEKVFLEVHATANILKEAKNH